MKIIGLIVILIGTGFFMLPLLGAQMIDTGGPGRWEILKPMLVGAGVMFIGYRLVKV